MKSILSVVAILFSGSLALACGGGGNTGGVGRCSGIYNHDSGETNTNNVIETVRYQGMTKDGLIQLQWTFTDLSSFDGTLSREELNRVSPEVLEAIERSAKDGGIVVEL